MNGRYTFYKTLIVAFTLGALFLLWRLAEVVLILFAAIIFASAIRPLVQTFTRARLPLGIAILLVYFLVFEVLFLIFGFAVPPLFTVVGELVRDDGFLYQIGRELQEWAASLGYGTVVTQGLERLFAAWERLQVRAPTIALEEGPPVVRSIGETFAQLLLALVMAFYWLTARDQIQNLMLSLTPIKARATVETIWTDVEQTLGDYVRATVTLMVLVGTATFVGLYLLGVPYALPLGLIAGLFEAVPTVGPILGAAPAILIAATTSPTTAILVALLFVLIQFLENNIFVPRIMGDTVGLNPLVVIIALVAGGTLAGVAGALLAVPVAGALQVIVESLLLNPMIEEARETHLEGGIPIFDVPVEDEKEPDETIVV